MSLCSRNQNSHRVPAKVNLILPLVHYRETLLINGKLVTGFLGLNASKLRSRHCNQNFKRFPRKNTID